MGRPRRLHYANRLVVVTQRCHNGKRLLASHQTRSLYLQRLQQIAAETGYEVVRHRIRDNSVELLLRTPVEIEGHTLSSFMHRLNTSFGKRYNKLHQRQGTVWGGRFVCIWLLNGEFDNLCPDEITGDERRGAAPVVPSSGSPSAEEALALKKVEEALANGDIPPTPSWVLLIERCAKLLSVYSISHS